MVSPNYDEREGKKQEKKEERYLTNVKVQNNQGNVKIKRKRVTVLSRCFLIAEGILKFDIPLGFAF